MKPRDYDQNKIKRIARGLVKLQTDVGFRIQDRRRKRQALMVWKAAYLSYRFNSQMHNRNYRFPLMLQMFRSIVIPFHQRGFKIEQAWCKWKQATRDLRYLSQRAEVVRSSQQDLVTSHLIESLYINKHTVDLIQTDQIRYKRELRHDPGAIMENSTRFYALLIARLGQISHNQKLRGFHQILRVSRESLGKSVRQLKRIKENIAYLRDIRAIIQ